MISVILPCYNCAPFIIEAVESVASLKFIVQIICVENGSTDETPSKLIELKSRYPFKLILDTIDKANVSVARNRGLELSNQPYVIFLDSDDFIQINQSPDLLSILEGEIDFIGFPYSSEVSEIGQVRGVLRNFVNYEQYFNFTKGKISSFQSRSCILRRDILVNYNLKFSEQIRVGEDTFFTMQFLSHCNTFSYFPEVCYFYRVYEESTSRLNQYSVEKLTVQLNGMKYAISKLEPNSSVSFLNIAIFKQAMEVSARLYRIDKEKSHLKWMIYTYFKTLGVNRLKKLYHLIRYLKYSFS